ncbi:MAG: hypothetical protein M3N46_07005 [Actinomycetota bacterium]|nr:hypothetical protein [Actinomycetota bacterium]
MAVRVVDYSPLTASVTPRDVAAWRAQAKASGAQWASVNVSTVVTIVVGCVVALIFLNVVVGTVTTASLSNGAGAASTIVMVLIYAGIAAIVAVRLRARFVRGGRWTRWLRLSRFAQANGMTFSPAQGDPSYPGEIFQLGRDRSSLDHLTTASGRFLDMGNFRWITGSGKSQTTHNWGFLALRLDRNMPNMVLDSKANNTIFGSNLPATLDRDQILHLEGDFDRYFTLYCPAQYEQDALYIFTPDLMALLIDVAAPFDVELIDEWMFVYSSRPFTMTDPTVLQRLFTIADTVGAKALDQTEHYADSRVGDFDANVIAPQGARLKRGVSLAAIVVVVVFVVIWGWTFLGPIISSLGGG